MTAIKSIYLALNQIIGTAVLFPIWWYTRGTADKFKRVASALQDCGKLFHVGILIRHLFTPLYGSGGLEAKLISTLVRSGHLVVHLIITIVHTTFFILALVLWLALPIFVIANIIYQVTPDNFFNL